MKFSLSMWRRYRRPFYQAGRGLLRIILLVVFVLPPELPLLIPAPVAAAASADAVFAPQSEAQDVAQIDGLWDSPEINTVQSTNDAIEANGVVQTQPLGISSELTSAYIETFDLGDGERGMLLSSDPVRYLAENGEWTPIDPRFTQEVDGFYNRTNIMRVQTGARQAVMEVSHDELDARWTPFALTLVESFSGGTRELVLAKPRPTQAIHGVLSEDGQRVTYPGSWSMVGMDDEIVSGMGEAEHNVLFAQPPTFDEVLKGETPSADARLVLSARLELPPGAQLWADGIQQEGYFSTTNTIEIRNHEGTTRLNLTPAVVFEAERTEQDHAEQAIVATYHVEPINLRSWEIRMETPLAWWLDRDRQYPVVWDPMMQVLRAIDVAQVYENSSCAGYLAQQPWLVGVGRATCVVGSATLYSPVRTLLRFNQVDQMNLPPQAEILGGILLVAPTDGYVNYTSRGQFNPVVPTRLHPITQNWDPATVRWNNQPAVGNAFLSNSTSYQGRNDPPLRYTPPPYNYSGRNSGTKYLLQNGPNGIVTDWLNGTVNYGLELRAVEAHENGSQCYNGCNFVQIPKRSVWPRATRDQFFENDFESVEGGGFMLLVRYRGPQLTNNVPFQYTGVAPKPPKFETEDFHRTRHHYRLPTSAGSPWLVVGSKGFRDQVYANGVLNNGLFSYPRWSQTIDDSVMATLAAGGEVAAASSTSVASPDAVDSTQLSFQPAYAFPMAVATENCRSANCETRSEGGGNKDGSNFIVLKAGAANGREVRIDPLAPDPNLKQYVVQASWSTALPAVSAADVGSTGTSYLYTRTLSTSDIVQGFHLDLPANVQLRIATTVTVEGLFAPSASVTTHLFPPTRDTFAKSDQHIKTGTERFMASPIPQAGTYGVVLELPGDKSAFNDCGIEGNGCEGGSDPEGLEPRDREVEVVLAIQVCPARSIPDGDNCQIVPTPDWTKGPDFWRTVGPYRVYTPAGFTDSCGGYANYVCVRSKDANNVSYATVVTWGDQIGRALIIAHSNVGNANDQNTMEFNPVSLYIRTFYGMHVLGKLDSENLLAPGLYLGKKSLAGGTLFTPYELSSGWLEAMYGCSYYDECLSLPLSDFDMTHLQGEPTLRLQMKQDDVGGTATQYAEYTAKLIRPLNTINGPQEQQFTLTWRVQAEGYRGRFESPQGNGPTYAAVAPGASISGAPVAGLTYVYSTNWEVYYGESEGRFTEFRNNNGRIYQPMSLGGAWNYVDYVVLDFGKAPSGGSGLAMCPGFCGDVRAPDDTWAAPKREWKMPDVMVNQLPNTVMVSSPGSLEVYSTDHPSSIGQANDTYGMSFKTFGAKVELTDGVCPGGASTQPVPLIKGTTSLSMPGLDPNADPQADASAIPSITASFVLCENVLRQVNITFRYPPGIPVAAPPVLYVDMIGGTVTIGPENVVISIDVGFYIGTGQPRIIKGVATLTIDTRGLFDLQAVGRVMGMMDAEGHLWVAWNPLDMGMGSQGWLPNKNDWVITGFIYAHVWRGSGWQNKYPWLAGNDDFHLTSSYQAQFRIAKGAVVDEWPIVIPPGRITIGVELSFGQFCNNSSCTSYEWGIKGKVTIAGFDVGIYVSLDCPPLLAAVVFPPAVLLCSSFILGSDDHLLIDQYGGNGPPFPLMAAVDEWTSPDAVEASDAWLATANRTSVVDPNAAQVDQTLVVKSSATSMMVAFGWVRGNPDFALVKPDGTTITKANAASVGAVVTTTTNSVIFGIQSPTPGNWIARVSNATAMDDYRMMYFANKATPALAFTAPTGVVSVNANGDSTGSQTYRIQWTPPANAAQLSMSLFYSATVLNPTSDGYQYGGVIREEIDPAAGAFDWELTHLASGDYRIYATLQDKKGAQVSQLGTDQYVGVSKSFASGTLRYLDQSAPPMPNAGSVTYKDMEDGVLVCWDANPAHDLSEYHLTYRISDSGYFDIRSFNERVPAVVNYAAGARQCARIGGIVSGETVIEFGPGQGIAARDASGNISGFATPSSYVTQASSATHVGPDAPVLSGSMSNGTVNLSWAKEAGMVSYEVFYARESFAGPHQPGTGASQGSSPILIDGTSFNGSYALNELPRGYWYAFAVRQRGSNSAAPPSLLSNQVWLLVSNGADSNGDGCPDDWEAAHQPYNGSANPDGDGLTTAQECKLGTNPNLPDTDGDGTIDGVEVQRGSNPLDPSSVPMLTEQEANAGATLPIPATLGVDQTSLSFIAFTQGPNPATQSVAYANWGDGSFKVNLTDNQPWLSATVNGNNIVVAIEKKGLQPGTYRGVVQVAADPASTLGSPQTIQVQLIVLADWQPGQMRPIYLPRVSRH